MESLLVSAAYAFFHLACLFFLCLRYWRNFRSAHPERRFNYRITDIWAAMAGLTPSLALIAFIGRMRAHEAAHDAEGLTMIAALLASSQIAGLFIGRLNIEIPPHTGAETAFASAVSIITGAFIGMVLCPVIFFAAVIPAAFIGLILWILPGCAAAIGVAVLCAAVCFAYWRKSRKHCLAKRRKPLREDK